VEIIQDHELPQAAPQEPPREAMSPFELGASIGRSQAFGLIANRASAAQAEILKQVHDTRSFESLGLSWNEFCERHAGISGSYGYKIVQRLNEFGEAFFKLTQIVRISPEFYRALAPAISDEGIEIDGQAVAIVPENALVIRQAVRRLQEALTEARQAPPFSIIDLQKRLDACLNEMAIMAGYPGKRDYHPSLLHLVVYCQNKLKRIENTIPKF
jgi:hypothetical protein